MTSIELPRTSNDRPDRAAAHHVHVNALTGYRAQLTAQINQHAEDAAMWIAPESTGWGLLTITQRVALTREHLDHLDRLSALRDQVDRILADTRHRDITTRRDQ